jgi:SNF2 family DNA or RNA helicase
MQDRASFKDHFGDPIKRGKSTKATEEGRKLGNDRLRELQSIMRKYRLGRKKESLTGVNKLKGKDDIVVLCDMSPLQVRYSILHYDDSICSLR